MRRNPTTATVDFTADGVHHGFLRVPHSRDESAWGAIMVPLTVIRNGDGPTALLTGGNHGDEYEGPIVLFELATGLRLEEISGRVIMVPAMNYPAFRAGRRTSPLDGGNMNRIFPGKPDGTVTEKLADYFQHQLLPMADVVLDIHSGGRTLQFLPFAAAHPLVNKEHEALCVAAMRAFNAPYGVMLRELDNIGMYDTAAEEMGKVFVSTELGGGGSASAKTVAIARRGVRNLLKHAGILAGEIERAPSVRLDMLDERCVVTSETTGLLEMHVDLGAEVHAGQVIARVHDVERTGASAVDCRAAIDGILAGRHFPGLVTIGDVIGVVAVPAAPD